MYCAGRVLVFFVLSKRRVGYLPIPLTLLTVALQLKTLLTYVLAVLLSSKLLAVVSIVARASFSVAVSSPAVLGFGCDGVEMQSHFGQRSVHLQHNSTVGKNIHW